MSGLFPLESLNIPFLAAGILSFAIWGIHTFAGGAAIARPLLAVELDSVVKYTQYYCWHIVTIVLLAVALAFTYSAFRTDANDLGWVMTVLAAAFALWGLLLPPFVRQAYSQLPQGWLFVPVALLGLWGLLS